ncbi:MAG: SDR family oxidoreductase [Pseudomonadota bacterium]
MTTVLITGASRGIGFALTQRYIQRADTTVIACCRNPQDAAPLQALAQRSSAVEIEPLDVADPADFATLKTRVGARPIDILISNAGIFGKSLPATTGFEDQRFGASDFEHDWVAPFRINAIAPMMLAETFVDNVAQSTEKKMPIITSIVGSITRAHGFMFGYAASKAAANMTARNLSVALRERDIIVNPVHPGYVRTEMSGENADIDIDTSIDGVLRCIDGMSLETSGEFLSYNQQPLPW